VKDLMRRLGHASPVASHRYLHAVDGHDDDADYGACLLMAGLAIWPVISAAMRAGRE